MYELLGPNDDLRLKLVVKHNTSNTFGIHLLFFSLDII